MVKAKTLTIFLTVWNIPLKKPQGNDMIIKHKADFAVPPEKHGGLFDRETAGRLILYRMYGK
jgi:hypothetical protein